MCHGLGVSCDAVVLLGREIDVCAAETGENIFNFVKVGLRGTVLNEDEGLALGINVGAVEGVAANDVNIIREVLLEGSDLGSFARCLTSDDGTLLCSFSMVSMWENTRSRGQHTWPIHRGNLINGSCFNVVNNVIACSGNKMTIGEDFDLLLWNVSALVEGRKLCTRYLHYVQIPRVIPRTFLPCRKR